MRAAITALGAQLLKRFCTCEAPAVHVISHRFDHEMRVLIDAHAENAHTGVRHFRRNYDL